MDDTLQWRSQASGDTAAAALADQDDELHVSCRTKSKLAAVPDILSTVLPVLVVSGNEIILDFIIHANHSFRPGEAPRSCPESLDDIGWLPAMSANITGVAFPFKVELAALNKLRARVKFERLGQDIVLAFRLKYREGPDTPRDPKKAAFKVTVPPGQNMPIVTRI
ncbi:hypothetical protein OOT46_20140 [Aquabacterium sp. A7-Y]|uniref:hypothetical protein n=1 Tax=Aquabacterium sp. A7-Y TaxID=1349605 RepID=UPI00223D023F|nr:hypothetical protein [Aquabacterium sp. A7-Y]MCW7540148.1 hypothetical protein [Aquabacterium sp. A7-Y]